MVRALVESLQSSLQDHKIARRALASLRGRSVSSVAVLVTAAALLAAPWAGHIDDTDAQLYQVLARNMAAARSWLEPGLPPGSSSPFREHLPFGLWPSVATVRLVGERALPLAGAAFSLLTVLVVLTLAPGAGGLAAALVLAATETFFLYGGRPRLDPPLILFATLAAVLVLRPRPHWVLATVAASLGALVKGPFGIAPFACAVVARAISERSTRTFLLGAAGTLLALAPAALFVWLADPSWRDRYLHAQVLASATGARSDGSTAWWAALASVGGRFWPGLPFALLAAFRRRDRTLALTCALLLVALSLPVRKVWNHELVAYPLLALLAGEWLAPHVQRWSRFLPVLAAVALAFAASGLGSRLLPPPCVASREFAEMLPEAGTRVLVVSASPEWRTLAGLAAEQRLDPWSADRLEGDARFALVREELFTAGPWRAVSRARGWVLAVR
jgi:4-amino-4-deoxy-L-arabinose transferase-like glycosyltransferase